MAFTDGARVADRSRGAAMTDDVRGGTWLTYRYRLGGAATEAQGTIKAPSFLTAARRLLAHRLAGHLGSQPSYLRLRAAGEQEVLLRITPPTDDGAPGLEVVPADTFRFGEPDHEPGHEPTPERPGGAGAG